MASPSICSSSSNHSPHLPSISFYCSLPTKPSSVSTLQQPLPSQSSSSSVSHKLGLIPVSDDLITTTANAVALANAALQAARDAASFSSSQTSPISFHETDDTTPDNDGAGDVSVLSDWKCLPVVVVRDSSVSNSNSSRYRRRKRRKGLNFFEVDARNDFLEKSRSSRPSSSNYLTAREEAEFSMDLKEGARLEAARNELWDTKREEPTTSEWAEAVGMNRSSLERAILRTSQSRNRITLSYKRLVISIATAYQGRGLTLQDLVQEGSIGLLRGTERFDSGKGFKLSTYVYWWIKQAIIRAIEQKSRTIRLPGSMCEMVAKIAKTNTALTSKLGRWPTHEEIADTVGVGVSVIRLASESNRTPISLDQTPSTIHGSVTLKEIIPGPEETRPETMVKRQQMKQNLHELLKTTLTEREEFVLYLHFGLNGDTPRSCDEIGRVLHLSRERVRQIRGSALAKLRDASALDDLAVYAL
ncbi:hypothetical protein MKW94_030418 [Papaver nudicaule]|uniref:Sigma factor n=1 Tax=Papaver nudicaule TaxID=74823 RepID=A0AA41V262_PAPNU|nr:hypothetical protein [Papaver nudicaule]